MRKELGCVQSSTLASSFYIGIGLHQENAPSALLCNAFHFTVSVRNVFSVSSLYLLTLESSLLNHLWCAFNPCPPKSLLCKTGLINHFQVFVIPHHSKLKQKTRTLIYCYRLGYSYTGMQCHTYLWNVLFHNAVSLYARHPWGRKVWIFIRRNSDQEILGEF